MQKRTKIKQKQFLEIFIQIGNISDACKAIGIGTSTYHDWVCKYPKFNKKMRTADLHFVNKATLRIMRDNPRQIKLLKRHLFNAKQRLKTM